MTEVDYRKVTGLVHSTESFGKKGAKIIDGLWVLIFQGIEAFSLWSDKINADKSFFSKDDVLLIHKFLEGNIKEK